MYSTKFHPEETNDKFADDAYLIKVANTVDALKNNNTFQKAVKNGTYDRWALKMVEGLRREREGARAPRP